MRAWVGTSGFSYAAWVGSFYPEDIASTDMLRFYATKLTSVEINNTFYRMPKSTVLAKWAGDVPETFQFVLKAPQRITHLKRLKDVGEDVSFFFKTAETLGARFGPVLFQLPPFSKKDVSRLRDLLAAVPANHRVALEFRNVTWLDDEVYGVLREHGAALCVAEAEGLATPMVSTAPWGYLRLRMVQYDDAALREWVARVRAQPWDEVFIFFKHEDEATGPRLAARFIELWGEPATAT